MIRGVVASVGAVGALMAVQHEELPWLRRHREMLKLAETVKRLKETHVYSSEEIVRVVGERYRKVRPRRRGLPGRIEFELKRLEVVFNVSYSRLLRVARLPSTREMSEFHRALVLGFVGEEYDEALRAIRRSLRLIKEFWNQYRLLIVSAADAREAARLRKEGSGRILSVVRRLRKRLELLDRVRRELLQTHIVSEGLPIVVVAGIPSTGKSTLVRRASTAEPEVASYPFTTKTVIVGKTKVRDVAFYMVDTPGILERPLEQHNEIERKAFAALQSLPDVVLFLVDPSPEMVQDIEHQMRLLKDVYTGIIANRGAGLIVAVNKVDITPRERVERAVEAVNEALAGTSKTDLCASEPLLISALTGEGVDRLLDTVYQCLRVKTPWLFGG
ncbi:NOG1 family protein [Pyrodictium abyssi]|uniref:NOG1 family protein n=2 Tax=Pyrodictium abyssi TaxID=54256 RepID=A0ABM8ISW8_9CREN|nr:NOG1 family protein [Pyrodictium abyssi]